MGLHAKSLSSKNCDIPAPLINWRLWLIRSAIGEPRYFFLFWGMNSTRWQSRACGISGRWWYYTEKNYSSKNWQMSAPLKIDVFGLSGLHMEHLTKFYFVSGANSCGIKTRSYEVPGERLDSDEKFSIPRIVLFQVSSSESRYLWVIRSAKKMEHLKIKGSFYNTCHCGWMQTK